MTRLEYLKKCITSGKIIENKNWYINCFAIPLLKEDATDVSTLPHLAIVTKMDGLYYVEVVDGQHTLVKISDFSKNAPLFNFQEVLEVDASWLPNIDKKQACKIGVLIVNTLILYPCFGNRLHFLNPGVETSMNMSDIETLLVNKAKSPDDAGPNDILVSEMVDCIGRFSFLSNLSTLISIAATPKTITPPPGIEQIRAKLTKEYEGQLDDPVKVVELEGKLNQVDSDYLKEDPAANKIFTSKSRTARKKMFLMYGETKDFVPGKGNVVVPSLSQGVNTEPENFPKYMNDLRYASFSRGASTQYAGYAYKVLQRSLSGLTIVKDPCNTTKGIRRNINKSTFNKLVNRYVKDGGWKLVSDIEMAKKYMDHSVEIRSPMYCTSPGNTVCYKCMSENYKNSPNGISNLAATISDILLNMFLKMMHGTKTEVIEMKMEDLVT